MRRLPIAAAAALSPGAVQAHGAFGDLGAFYGALLHPLADPAQGLVLTAIAVLLARQPLESVRRGWVALALAGSVTVILGAFFSHSAPGLAIIALAAVALGLTALIGVTLGRWAIVALSAAAAVAAGLAVDLPPGLRAGGLAALGGALGIALAPLLVWGIVDLLQRRLGSVAGAVAGSWIAAVGLMAAAFAFTGV